MKILYTKHAEKKFKDLKELGVWVSKRKINQTIRKPIHIDKETDKPKIITSGKLGKDHIIRVVYKRERGIITVITFYPARAGRYFV